MILKYNLSSQIFDAEVTDVKWIIPTTITLANINKYNFTSIVISKGTPYEITIDTDYIVRYFAIFSDNSFSLSINNGLEYITKTQISDYGVNRTGFTGINKINTIKITNPTGASGPVGSQFSNPVDIEIKYLLVLEKI